MEPEVPGSSAEVQAHVVHAVFISYSAKDRKIADAICEALEAQDIKCWIAPRDIAGGKLYPGAIVEAINSSRVLVLVFSSNSNTSNDVMNEVERAFQNEIPIIPFKVENVQPSLNMQYFLSTPQFLNAFKPPLKFHLENLVDTVGALLKVPRKITRKRHFSPTQFKLVAGVVLLLLLVTSAVLMRNLLRRTSPQTLEKQYSSAVEMLSSPDLPRRREGIRLLGKISEAGGDYWYWQAMNQLTGYIKDHSALSGSEAQPPRELPQDVIEILQVIAAKPPVYPANFTESDKMKKRRDLKRTDLRGLRLVENAHLEYVDLEGANLASAVLFGANLEGAMLKQADLTNANLGSACLEGIDLSDAELQGANLRTTKDACPKTVVVKSKVLPDIDNLMLAQNWWCAGLSAEVLKEIKREYGEIPKCE
jgi:hypothetical protein